MASERIQRHIDSSLDEADQAVANEGLPTVASRARAVLRMDHENQDTERLLSLLENLENVADISEVMEILGQLPRR